jgi:AcrR family transcriptional regulator
MDSIKKRKTVQGEMKNKERTMQRWLEAVGEVLREKGYSGLTTRNIVDKAGMDRRLISLYFGSVDKLIETYLDSVDYWKLRVSPKLESIIHNNAENFGEEETVSILQTLFNEVYDSIDLQRIFSWQINEYHPSLRKLADEREAIGSPLLKLLDPHFENTGLEFRAMMALQLAGIYYMNAHAKVNGSTFCEVDINTEEGKQAVLKALKQLTHIIFESVKMNK